MTPKICISILPNNLGDALKMLAKAEAAGADFIEVRLDELDEDTDVAVLTADCKVPLIATDKAPAAARDPLEHRFLLLNAAKHGFKYIDVDLETPNLKTVMEELRASSARCIVSYHDNKGCPSHAELHAILAREMAMGADVCKIVVTASQMQDNLSVLEFTAEASKQAKIICFCMGELGRNSRLQSPLYGGFFTFAALDSGCATAPGQMTIREMRAAYDLLGP